MEHTIKHIIGVGALGLILALTGCPDEGQDQAEPEDIEPAGETAEQAEAAEPEAEQAPEQAPGQATGGGEQAIFGAGGPVPSEAKGSYELDPAHSFVLFSAKHFDFGQVHGRFNGVEGTIEIAESIEDSSVKLEIAADSVYTAVKKRDDHLKSPDFLNAKQFPKLTFESTSVKHLGGERYDVTGKLSLHGETKEITVPMHFLGAGTFPPDKSYRVGFHGEHTLDRGELGMTHMSEALGTKTPMVFSIEAVKQE